jgi:immunoglobulin-binding protein 1
MLENIRKSSRVQESTHEDDTRNREREKSGYSDRLDGSMSQLLKGAGSGPLLSKDGKPLQIFTLTDKRSQLQKGVFRPGHNLPTMSIDEYLEEEKRRGGVVQGGEQSGIPPEIDEDDLDKADEETEKARAWDEFKENNPKGSGNTLNRG